MAHLTTSRLQLVVHAAHEGSPIENTRMVLPLVPPAPHTLHHIMHLRSLEIHAQSWIPPSLHLMGTVEVFAVQANVEDTRFDLTWRDLDDTDVSGKRLPVTIDSPCS